MAKPFPAAVLLGVALLAACAAPPPTVRPAPAPAPPSPPPAATPVPAVAAPTAAPEPPVTQPSLVGTAWRLVELYGKPAFPPPGDKAPWFLLKAEGNRVQGFGGCNPFTGSFELAENEGRIAFRYLSSTLKACPTMATETSLLKVLEAIDGYSLDGNRLLLRRGKMAPLAAFLVAREQ